MTMSDRPAIFITGAASGMGREGAKLFLVALGVFFPIYLNTLHGIRNVDPALVDDVIMGCVGQGGEQVAGQRGAAAGPGIEDAAAHDEAGGGAGQGHAHRLGERVHGRGRAIVMQVPAERAMPASMSFHCFSVIVPASFSA